MSTYMGVTNCQKTVRFFLAHPVLGDKMTERTRLLYCWQTGMNHSIDTRSYTHRHTDRQTHTQRDVCTRDTSSTCYPMYHTLHWHVIHPHNTYCYHCCRQQWNNSINSHIINSTLHISYHHVSWLGENRQREGRKGGERRGRKKRVIAASIPGNDEAISRLLSPPFLPSSSSFLTHSTSLSLPSPSLSQSGVSKSSLGTGALWAPYGSGHSPTAQ